MDPEGSGRGCQEVAVLRLILEAEEIRFTDWWDVE